MTEQQTKELGPVEMAEELNQLRQKIVENKDAGRAPWEGIDEGRVKRAIRYLRKDRMKAAEGSTKKKASKKKEQVNFDLNSLFDNSGKKEGGDGDK